MHSTDLTLHPSPVSETTGTWHLHHMSRRVQPNKVSSSVSGNDIWYITGPDTSLMLGPEKQERRQMRQMQLISQSLHNYIYYYNLLSKYTMSFCHLSIHSTFCYYSTHIRLCSLIKISIQFWFVKCQIKIVIISSWEVETLQHCLLMGRRHLAERDSVQAAICLDRLGWE